MTTSHKQERRISSARLRASQAFEDLNAKEELAMTLAKTGQNPSIEELEVMSPGLRRRDYNEILFRLRRIVHPSNRSDRRRRSAIDRRNERRWDRAVERLLPAYERLISSEFGRKCLSRLRNVAAPHPDGRYAPSALDTNAIRESKQSMFEMVQLFREARRSRRIHGSG